MPQTTAIPQLFELLRQHTLSEHAQARLRSRRSDHLTPQVESDLLRRAQMSWGQGPT